MNIWPYFTGYSGTKSTSLVSCVVDGDHLVSGPTWTCASVLGVMKHGIYNCTSVLPLYLFSSNLLQPPAFSGLLSSTTCSWISEVYLFWFFLIRVKSIVQPLCEHCPLCIKVLTNSQLMKARDSLEFIFGACMSMTILSNRENPIHCLYTLYG